MTNLETNQEAFKRIDHIVCGDGFVAPRVCEYIQQLQAALVTSELPLSFSIATQLLPLVGKTVFLFTGFVVPGLYPDGENDGPLGTLALARALAHCGLIPTVWVDPPLHDNAMWLAAELGTTFPIRSIDVAVVEKLMPQAAAAIAIEKPGRNAQGVMHTFDGIAIDGGSIPIDELFLKSSAETLTVGIGDRGNEIGFGSIHSLVGKLLPPSSTCQCPCHGGVICVTPTQLLLPAAVSNWGAYGIAAALAIFAGNPSLMITPQEEKHLLHVAAVRGCVDGVKRRGGFGVDGLAGDVSISVVQALCDVVEAALRSKK